MQKTDTAICSYATPQVTKQTLTVTDSGILYLDEQQQLQHFQTTIKSLELPQVFTGKQTESCFNRGKNPS